jgi:hypothetical protein
LGSTAANPFGRERTDSGDSVESKRTNMPLVSSSIDGPTVMAAMLAADSVDREHAAEASSAMRTTRAQLDRNPSRCIMF